MLWPDSEGDNARNSLRHALVPAPKLTGRGAEWFQHYVQEFGETPQPYVAYGHEAINVALDAVARAGNGAWEPATVQIVSAP